MKILEIELLTNDLPSTEKFYSDVLELKINDRKSDSISFITGHSTLRFRESLKTGSKYHFAFNIPHNKIEESIPWISNKIKPIKSSKDQIITRFENWNAESIYFYDNNLNILEFISRFDLKNSSYNSFDRNSILSISEIGIVADKPLVLAEELIEKHKLEYFVKGPKREDFVALGDDNGLFVISKPKRTWYPTNDRAENHLVRVMISINDTIRQIEILP